MFPEIAFEPDVELDETIHSDCDASSFDNHDLDELADISASQK